MDRKGEITVFLAMILVSICSLLCVMAESVRTAGARCYLRMGVDSAADSLMAQYHRELWKKYRILGLEFDSPDTLEREAKEFLSPYMSGRNWYPMKIARMESEDVTVLTEGNGRYMEQEILDYMKYGLIDTNWEELDEAGAGELLEMWKEGGSMSRVSRLYLGHSKEAIQLEKILEKIDGRLKSQTDCWSRASGRLGELDGDGFIFQAENEVRELQKLPGLVKAYEKKADRLKESLDESRERFEAEKENLGPETQAAFEEEIGQYEAYVSQEGQRRQEVARLKEESPARIQWIRGAIAMAEDVMDEIDSWEGGDEEEELDEGALWRPVQRYWEGYDMLSLGVEFGVKDKEKEGLLEQVGSLALGGLLERILPEGTVVSGKKLPLEGVSSVLGEREEGRQEDGIPGGVRNLFQRLLVGEYGTRFFKGFQKEGRDKDYYELEYIVNGKGADRDNLSGTAARLVALREGLNLIHLFSDPGKRQEARNLALAIVGGSGFLPLVFLTMFLIMSVWALGEAMLDVRCLLDGGKVPVFKTKNDWKLGLEGLLDIGRSRGLGELGSADQSTAGLDYRGYMRILIFGAYGRDTLYRMMDLMEINIRRKQKEFSMGRCACKVDMVAAVSGKHVFFLSGLWKNGQGDCGFGYETRMSLSGSYLEDR